MSETKTGDQALGKRIQALRKENGLTQGELAAEASKHGAPIYQQTVAKIESGTRALKFEEGLSIAKALQVDPTDLTSEGDAEARAVEAALLTSASNLHEYALKTGVLPLLLKIIEVREAEANYRAHKLTIDPDSLNRLDPVSRRADFLLAVAYSELGKTAELLVRFMRDEVETFQKAFPDLWAAYQEEGASKPLAGGMDQDPVAYLDHLAAQINDKTTSFEFKTEQATLKVRRVNRFKSIINPKAARKAEDEK